MRLIITRHGETEENARHICQGQTPGTLSARGINEAHRLGEALKSEKIAHCFCSDQKRAADTAEIALSHRIGEPVPLTFDDRLRERYFGSFEGKVFPPFSDEVIPLEEVETAAQIAVRLRSFLADVVTKFRDEETVLIVSHGFTLRVLLALLRGENPVEITDIRTPDNCSITEVECTNGGTYRFLRTNDRSHL